MTQTVRQSTQVVVRIGPFVDVTDGFTPETGITLGAADEAELLKAAGAATTDISGATWAAITGCDGWYNLTLTTAHTDTVGTLDIVVHDDSVCLPVHARFQVIEEAAYDSFYAASADPKADINVASIDAGAVTSIQSGLATAAALDAVDNFLDTEIAAIQADTDDIQARLPAALVGGRIDASVGAMAANVITATATAADFVTEVQTGLSVLDAVAVRAAVGLASANLDTQLAAIDDAVDTEVAAVLAAVDTEVAAIKAKTDSLTFTVAGVVDANVQNVNDVAIVGDGSATPFNV